MRNWKTLASALAIDAYENHFSSRRGVWFLEDVGVLCLFNNNPYAADPGMRDKETAKFRAAMEGAGIEELAYATYPREGEDAGYTYAMILDADRDKTKFVSDMMAKIVKESLVEMT